MATPRSSLEGNASATTSSFSASQGPGGFPMGHSNAPDGPPGFSPHRGSNSTQQHSKSSPKVAVTATTWSRDSHDLFDFEAAQNNVHTKIFEVAGRSTTFVRQGTEVNMLTDHNPTQQAQAGQDTLIRLVRRDGVFWVDRASGSSKRLWLVVRDLPNRGHKLSEGDLIKLGRFKLRVRQMVAVDDGQIQPDLGLQDPEVPERSEVPEVDPATGAPPCCRICLLEGSSDEDPLITPCKCKGTIEYVHLACLRYWIKGRLNLGQANGGSYFYRPVTCELCKTPFPDYVRLGRDQGKTALTEVPYTRPPFVVLENTLREVQQQQAHRGLHVISLAENKLLKLGRGHESDVRIADVSISRWHATIRVQEDGQFVVEDRDSKFGTLVALKKPRPLEARSPVSIQMGRTLLAMNLKDPSSTQTAPTSAIAQVLPSSVPSNTARSATTATSQSTNPEVLHI